MSARRVCDALAMSLRCFDEPAVSLRRVCDAFAMGLRCSWVGLRWVCDSFAMRLLRCGCDAAAMSLRCVCCLTLHAPAGATCFRIAALGLETLTHARCGGCCQNTACARPQLSARVV
eukprot:7268885-Alexandrium_andersonii.AAC.1